MDVEHVIFSGTLKVNFKTLFDCISGISSGILCVIETFLPVFYRNHCQMFTSKLDSPSRNDLINFRFSGFRRASFSKTRA